MAKKEISESAKYSIAIAEFCIKIVDEKYEHGRMQFSKNDECTYMNVLNYPISKLESKLNILISSYDANKITKANLRDKKMGLMMVLELEPFTNDDWNYYRPLGITSENSNLCWYHATGRICDGMLRSAYSLPEMTAEKDLQYIFAARLPEFKLLLRFAEFFKAEPNKQKLLDLFDKEKKYLSRILDEAFRSIPVVLSDIKSAQKNYEALLKIVYNSISKNL